MILNFICVGLAVAPAAEASERRFTYTYGSAVLPRGAVELEPWTTAEIGRDGFYLGLDHRVELEVGASDRLQTAFYLKWRSATEKVGDQLVTSSSDGGVSLELKWKLTDAVAAPVGLALYLEPELGLDEGGVEGKIIVDKRVGHLYVALNPVIEEEFEFESPDEVAPELKTEVDLGAAWFASDAFSAGVEVRQSTVLPAGEGVEFAALFAGPVVSYAAKDGWWVTGTVLPQLPALVRYDPAQRLELHDDSRLAARLIFGLDL
jgi:hypothetical protein